MENHHKKLHKKIKQTKDTEHIIQLEYNKTMKNRHTKLHKIIKLNKQNKTKNTEYTIQQNDEESTYETTHDNKTSKKTKRRAVNI